jgi:hypothetical protein
MTSTLQVAKSAKYRAVFGAILIFVGCFLGVAAAYHKTPINFFRAEGGLFQFVAHSSAADQQNYLHWFFHRSYHGHFTGIGYWLEFKTTQFAGTWGAFWRWRQLNVLAGVATAVFLLVRYTARSWGASKYAAAAAAAAMAAIFIYQPLMADLLSWTFLVFQLAWMLLSALTLFSLVKLVLNPSSKRWIWGSAIFAYASMHALGVGAVTAAATGLVLAILLLGVAQGKLEAFRGNKRTLALVLLLLVVFSVAHALCMILLNGPPTPPGTNLSPTSPIVARLGLVAVEFFAALQSLFVSDITAPTSNDSIATAWALGLGMFLLAGLAVFHLTRVALRAPDSRNLTMFVLHAFSIVSFLACVGLVAARDSFEPSSRGVTPFLFGARYVIPISFTLLGTMTALVLPIVARARPPMATLFLGVAAIMFLDNYEYRTHLYPKHFPRNQISHDRAWKLIKATVRECRAAHLLIPNIPLAPLTQEFHPYDLRLFEPLLHDELNLPADERCEFAEWAQCRGPLRPSYEQAVPSLKKVIAVLDLEPTPQR